MKILKTIFIVIAIFVGIAIFANVEVYFCPYQNIDFGVPCAHWGIFYLVRRYIIETGAIFVVFALPLFSAIIKGFSWRFSLSEIFKKLAKIYGIGIILILVPLMIFQIAVELKMQWALDNGAFWGIITIEFILAMAIGIWIIVDFYWEMKKFFKK